MPKEPVKNHTKKTARHRSVIKHHKKVFDIVPPGKAPAAPNSRSVVPSDKPPVPDDQFVPGAPRLRAKDPSEQRPLLDHHKPVELVPSKAQASQDQEVEPDSSDVSSAPDLNTEPASSTVSATPKPETQAAAGPLAASRTPSASEPPQVVTSIPEPSPLQTTPPAEPVSAVFSQGAPASYSPDQSEEAKAGQLAVEQVVDTNGMELSGLTSPATAPAPAQATTSPSDTSSARYSATSIDDLLAESGAPVIENEPVPGPIISHHKGKSSWAVPVLIFILVLLVAALALNFLLDAEIIRTKLELPHTDWL